MKLQPKHCGTLFTSLLLLFNLISGSFPAVAASQGRKPSKKAKTVRPGFRTQSKHLRQPNHPPVREPNEPEFEENVEARTQSFAFERLYPFQELPPDARHKAWEARPLPRFSPQAEQAWVSQGPTPTESFYAANWGTTSGRINTVSISPADPNIVLLGTASGGIWRSTDRGRAFVPVSDDQVDLTVGALAFAPGNPSIVYAGMGDGVGFQAGTGVLKSTDAGQSWKRVSNGTLPSPGLTTGLLVDPLDSNRVYLAQKDYVETMRNVFFVSGFFLSTDGGVNWRKTATGSCTDLNRDPVDGRTLYLALILGDRGKNLPPGLYKSTDGGETWAVALPSPYGNVTTTLTTRDLKIGISPAEPRRICLLTGGTLSRVEDYRLMTSTDGGQTWASQDLAGQVDTGQFGYNSYVAVDPVNINVMYIGTRDVFKSTDAGKTWSNLTRGFDLDGYFDPPRFGSTAHVDQHSLAFDPANSNRFLIANDGGLNLTEDGGKTFQSLNQSLSLAQFIGLAAHPGNPAFLYGGTQDTGTLRRRSLTEPWKDFAGGDGGNCVVDPVDPSIVYTTYIYSSISRYRENGDVFDRSIGSNVTFGEPATNPRIAFYPPFTGNGVDSTLYFGTWRLFISTDRGTRWTAPGGMLDLTKGAASNFGSDVLSTIGVSRSNSKVIYTGSRQGRVMTTNDGGANWRDITGDLPNRTIKSLVVHPSKPETAYLTVSGYGSGHVFRTIDSGTTWTDISGNLPNIPTNTLLLDPANPETLYVGTDIGVFRSTGGGNTWETFNLGIPPVIVTMLLTRPNGSILAATYGRGAYELKSTKPDVTPPTVKLLSPNGGEKFNTGTVLKIEWQSTDDVEIARHDIALSLDGGTTFPTAVATGLPGTAQTFSYAIPTASVKTQKARVRVTATDATGKTGVDTSDGNFKIRKP